MDSLIDSLHQLKLKEAKSIIFIYRPVYEKKIVQPLAICYMKP